MAIEEDVARQLVEKGWTIYSPTVVCDRIGVRDGKVYFLEFKKGHQELRPCQKAITELVPKMYLVIRHD